jgi:hypothetical protein
MISMKTRRISHPAFNLVLGLLLALGGSLSVFSTAHAQGIVYGDSIPAGVTIQNDVILYGNDVVVDGTVEGDVIALGNSVRVTGTITGTLVSASQSVSITGQVGGSLYAASLLLAFGPSSGVGHSVYFVGGELDTARGGTIARDINAVTLGARLEGELGRNMKAIIGPVELLRLAIQGVNSLLGADRIQLPPLLAPASALPLDPSLAAAGSPLHALMSMGPSALSSTFAAIDTDRLLEWLLRLGLDFVTFAALGLLLVLVTPSLLVRGAYRLRTSPWAALGWGMTVFATGIVGLLLATLVVLAVSMLFWALSLGALGALTFTVGLFSILLAGAVYVFLVLFCSKLVAAFLIGRLLLTPLSPRAADTKVWCVLLGVLVYLLLAAIPYLGWLVAVAATFFGLGAIWMTVRDTRQL